MINNYYIKNGVVVAIISGRKIKKAGFWHSKNRYNVVGHTMNGGFFVPPAEKTILEDGTEILHHTVAFDNLEEFI